LYNFFFLLFRYKKDEPLFFERVTEMWILCFLKKIQLNFVLFITIYVFRVAKHNFNVY